MHPDRDRGTRAADSADISPNQMCGKKYREYRKMTAERSTRRATRYYPQRLVDAVLSNFVM